MFIIGTIGIGLIYLGIFALFVLIIHALFLSRIKGYGIKVSEKQFPEIYAMARKASEKLILERVPDIYIYNMDGIFNAFATHFLSRNFVILTTSILDACKEDLKKIEFIVGHELVHIQRKHTRRQLLLAPSSMVPWLGNIYSRACEYLCDGVSGKILLDDKEESIRGVLILPTADKDRSNNLNLEAYEEQRAESGGFWMTVVEMGASHPFSFNRVATLRKIFGDDIPVVPVSIPGILLTPFFSIRTWIIVYVVIVMIFLGNSFLSGFNSLKDAQPTTSSSVNYNEANSEIYYTGTEVYSGAVLADPNNQEFPIR